MSTNQNGQIRNGDIQNQLTFIALILINGRVSSIEEGKKVAHDGDGNVGDGVKLLISQLFTGFVSTSDLGILPGNLLYRPLNGNLLNKLFSHIQLHF